MITLSSFFPAKSGDFNVRAARLLPTETTINRAANSNGNVECPPEPY